MMTHERKLVRVDVCACVACANVYASLHVFCIPLYMYVWGWEVVVFLFYLFFSIIVFNLCEGLNVTACMKSAI